MSEETAAYRVKEKSGFMNHNTRNEFASYGLEILKRAVLLVLYEETDPYPSKRILKAEKVREYLSIPKPCKKSVNVNSLTRWVLDHFRHEKHAYHYVEQEAWGITEKGISVIEGTQ